MRPRTRDSPARKPGTEKEPADSSANYGAGRLYMTPTAKEEASAMLVLTRKNRELIRIGQDVTVTVLGSTSNRVRLGIDAPASVAVWRGELEQDVQENGERRRPTSRRQPNR